MTSVSKHSHKATRLQFSTPTEDPLPSTAPEPLAPAPVQKMPRSILKKRTEALPKIATELDPLQCESYFLGPLRTLVASVENESHSISLHDITEAYILLSCRIEAQAAGLEDGTTSVPAVVAIRNLRSHMICAAIRRDVAYAICPHRVGDDDDDDSHGYYSHDRMSEEQKIDVRNQSSVCHASLRFLSNLFKFPALHQRFKLHELAWIFKELLDVGLSDDLLTVNPVKTYSHVICVVGNQRLPDAAIKPFRGKIATVVERAASGLLGGTVTNGPHVDGLRAVIAQLYRHGTLLFTDFHKVFKVTLQNLVCSVPAIRDLAVKALASFAHVALRRGVSYDDQIKYSTTVDAFIDKELQRASDIHIKDSSTFLLRDFMKLKEDDPSIIKRTIQLLNVTASLLVLSGPCVFMRPASLKFLIKAVEKTQPLRHREINQMRAATWSCLVRAYGLLSTWDVPKIPGLEESAFCVVRQEYREDVGISVIAVLLQPVEGGLRPLRRAKEVATYLYHLGQMPETRGVTAALLRRLLGGVLNDVDSETCTWVDTGSVIPEWLTKGSTLDIEPRKLRKVLASLGGIDMHTVRILEADELISTWESLVDAFQICAIGYLFDKKGDDVLQADLLLLWRALLRIQSALADDFDRKIVSKPILSSLATSLCKFLEATLTRFPIRAAQALLTTQQLWKAVEEEFGNIWAAALGSSIYRRLLKIWQSDIACGEMSNEWVQFSRSLIQAAPKRTLEILEELHDVDAQRVIWLDMVRQVRFNEQASKEVVWNLLIFPIKATEQVLRDETSFSYWDMLCLLSVTRYDPDETITVLAEELAHAFSVKQCAELRQFFTTALAHTSRFDCPASLPLLSVTSQYLEEAYPPDNHEDNEFMDIVQPLQKIIQERSSQAVIKSLERGLIPWFEDRTSHIPDIIYNNDILPLYCDILDAIRHISPIEEAFVDLADLIAAPFSRKCIPEPAVGPIAFKEFWEVIAPTLDFRTRVFPSNLQDCVISLHKAFGGYIPEWMQSQLESEGTHTSQIDEVIPASADDPPSSDFSPIMSRQSDRDRVVNRDDAVMASPSIGVASPQFARCRRDDLANTPVMSRHLGRAKKKRKLQQSAATFRHKDTLQADASVDPSSGDIVSSPLPNAEQLGHDHRQSRTSLGHADLMRTAIQEHEGSPDDYSAWEVGVSSEDVLNALEDGERTPRPHNPSPDIWDDVTNDSPTSMGKAGPKVLQVNNEHAFNRSQTAPASLQPSTEAQRTSPDDNPSRLRRICSTTAVPLDALEKLRAKLSTETHDMETQDLAQATRLTYDVLGILNGKMSEKLENRK